MMTGDKSEKSNSISIGKREIHFSEDEIISGYDESEKGIIIVHLSPNLEDIDWHKDFESAKEEYKKRTSKSPPRIKGYNSKGEFLWEFNIRPVLSFKIDDYHGREVVRIRTNAPFHDILFLLDSATGEIILETPTR